MHFSVLLSCVFIRLVSSVSQNGLPKTIDNVILTINTVMFIDDINSIDAGKMQFRLDYYLETEWEVSFNQCEVYQNIVKELFNDTEDETGFDFKEGIQLTGAKIKRFWVPDTFSSATKTVTYPTLEEKSMVLKITSIPKVAGKGSGCTMKLSSWLASLVSCQMDFKEYPVDIQRCPFPIRSRAYTEGFMQYKWKRDVIQKKDIQMLEHTLLITKNSYNKISPSNNGSYSYIVMCIIFKRNMGYSIVQVFVPTSLLVVLSYCTFWLALDSIPGRVTLCITTLLALITQYSNIKQRMPQISYMNPVDVFMLTCLVFVFSSMAELTVAIILSRISKEQVANNKGFEDYQEVIPFNNPLTMALAPKSCASCPYMRWSNSVRNRVAVESSPEFEAIKQAVNRKPTPPRDWAAFLDNIFRILYPLMFAAFNLTFWPIVFDLRENQEILYRKNCTHKV